MLRHALPSEARCRSLPTCGSDTKLMTRISLLPNLPQLPTDFAARESPVNVGSYHEGVAAYRCGSFEVEPLRVHNDSLPWQGKAKKAWNRLLRPSDTAAFLELEPELPILQCTHGMHHENCRECKMHQCQKQKADNCLAVEILPCTAEPPVEDGA